MGWAVHPLGLVARAWIRQRLFAIETVFIECACDGSGDVSAIHIGRELVQGNRLLLGQEQPTRHA